MMKTRKTPQKMAILKYLKGVRTHPTAEQVHKSVIKEIPTITLATVYRNLNSMADKGEILRLEIDHEYRYDAFCGSHIHFVCTNTGKIYDIEDKRVADLVNKSLPKGFYPESMTLILKGICK